MPDQSMTDGAVNTEASGNPATTPTQADPTKHVGLPASERDKLSPVWDMSQERAFNEQLLSQRFSFFVIFFGLCVAGALNARSQLHFQLVLTMGAVITILFARVLHRTHLKADLAIKDLFSDSTHPAKIIDDRCGPGSQRKVLAYYIPVLCCGFLGLGAFLAWTGCLRHASADVVPQVDRMPMAKD
jgi:hypothetical protein